MKKLNKKILAFSLSALMIAPLSIVSKTSYAEESSSSTSASESVSESSSNEETKSSEETSSSETSKESSSESVSSESGSTGETTASVTSTKTYSELDSANYDKLEDLAPERVTAVQKFLNELSTKSLKSKMKVDFEVTNNNEKADISIEGEQTVADQANMVANLKFNADLPQNNKLNGTVDLYSKDKTIYVDFKTDQNVAGTVKMPFGQDEMPTDLMKNNDLYAKATYKVKEHDSDHDEVYVLVGKDSIKDVLKLGFEASAKQQEASSTTDAMKQQLASMEQQIITALDEVEKFANVKSLVMPIELKVNNADNSVKEIKLDLTKIFELAVDYNKTKSTAVNPADEMSFDEVKIEINDIEVLASAPEITVPETVVNNAKDINEFVAGMMGSANTAQSSEQASETTTTAQQQETASEKS